MNAFHNLLSPSGVFGLCQIYLENIQVRIKIRKLLEHICSGNRRIATTQNYTHEIKNVFIYNAYFRIG